MTVRQFNFSKNQITDASDCFVIAEIGNNHCGDIKIAHKMIEEAKRAGADAVKFQKRENRRIFTEAEYQRPYESENSYGATYGLHREFLEFDVPQYQDLKSHAEALELCFFATAFDESSLDFLLNVGVDLVKVASGDLTNIPLIKEIANSEIPYILSTGGGTIEDVDRAMSVQSEHPDRVAVLQCTSAYPCSPADMNLAVIETYRKRYPKTIVGLSDHQNGIAMSLVGFALGARIIEKHFTLDRTLKGTDHSFSLEPAGLQKLVRDLRRARTALGDGIKDVYDDEKGPIMKMRKQLVAIRALPSGHTLAADDIEARSPGGGLDPYMAETVIGKTIRFSIEKDEALTMKMFEDG